MEEVTFSSAVSGTNGLDNMIDRSMTGGTEHVFNSSTQLQFGHDLPLNMVRQLLCSTRPVAIQTSVNPSASDQDLQQLCHLAQRTTAVTLGHGAFTSRNHTQPYSILLKPFSLE